MALIGAGLVILGVVAFLSLPKLVAQRATAAGGSAVPIEVNYQAPALNLKDLQGNQVSLSDYRGQTVLINNWATWCPPCRAEMPELKAYFEEHKGQNFTVLGIEAGEPVAEVADFVKSYGLTFPIWVDPEQKALVAFNNLSLPSSYLVDPSGTVRLAWSGAISRAVLEQTVTPLLEK